MRFELEKRTTLPLGSDSGFNNMETFALWYFLLAFVAFMSLDVAIWSKVLKSIRDGTYFAKFVYLGQPADLLLQLGFLLLLASPWVIAAIWLYSKVIRLLEKRKRLREIG